MRERDLSDQWRRRRFLSVGLYGGAGAALLSLHSGRSFGASWLPPEKEISLTGGMPAREFGRIPHRLPVLAFGGSAMVEKWVEAYGPVLPFSERVAMVRQAYDEGVRYFDTSRNYGESESILGAALKDVRNDIYLASKVGVRADDTGLLEPSQVRSSVEDSLSQLQTDYLDCIQIHGPVFEYRGYSKAMEVYEEVGKLREEKLCRFIGITGHNAFETMYRLIDTKLFDQALIAYGYFPKGMDTILSHANMQWRELCLSRAHELEMGVLAMKTMGSFVFGARASHLVSEFDLEKLVHLRQAALRWALKDSRITLLLVGISRPSDIDQNAVTLKADWTYTPADQKILAEFTSLAFGHKSIQSLQIT